VRRLHRWLGFLLLAPIVLWAGTGFLFHLKPGWAGAFESLSAAPPGAAVDPGAVVPVATAASAARAAHAHDDGGMIRAELFASDLGPLYRVELPGRRVLVDARSGQVRSPLDEAACRSLATAAAARAEAQSRYGEVRAVALDDDEARVAFAGGAVVTVDRHGGALAQRGRDTDRIDLLYRLHYVQWTGRPAIDRPAAVVFIALLLGLAALGFGLLVRH
jgi:hypothetical protein